jgi:hypothetical protein
MLYFPQWESPARRKRASRPEKLPAGVVAWMKRG